jgi:chromosome segregation ATPase
MATKTSNEITNMYDTINDLKMKMVEMKGDYNELQTAFQEYQKYQTIIQKEITGMKKEISKLNPVGVAKINDKLESLEHDVKKCNDGIAVLTGRINYISGNEKLI